LRSVRMVLLLLVLTISGCLFPPKPLPEGLVFEVLVNLNATGPTLSFTVICTNMGENAENVSEFGWVLGSTPKFSVLAPDGTFYDCISLSNLSMLAKQVLLEAGDSISATHDLFGEWTAWGRSDGVRFSTIDVFSAPGKYNVTATYRPFFADPDPSRRLTTLVSAKTFAIPPDFWAPYEVNVSITDLRLSSSISHVDWIVPTNRSNTIYVFTIFGRAVNHGDPGWATILVYLESDRGRLEKEHTLYFGAGASKTIFQEFDIPDGKLPDVLQYGITAIGQEPPLAPRHK